MERKLWFGVIGLAVLGALSLSHLSRGAVAQDASSRSQDRSKDEPEKSPGTETDRGRHGGFTGEVKLVFYVRDVPKTAEFYRNALGFAFHHYHDYATGESVKVWTKEDPPIYAEMSFAGRRFGLHLPRSAADEAAVGGMKVYFRMKNLDAHHQRVSAWGGKPSPVRDKPWMRMFQVTDPDGHRIYFAYTEDAVHGNPWYGS